jgi:hypothetical protein
LDTNPDFESGRSADQVSFFRISSDDDPVWFRAVTISGKPAGLGFQCPVCHLGYRHSAPNVIEHCGGKVESAPANPQSLPERNLGGPTLPSRFLKIGTW